MLKKKLYRDLRQNMSQFIVIFVMVMLAVLAFSGVHAYMDGMRVSSEEIYSEYNLADMWLTGEGFSQEEIADYIGLGKQRARDYTKRLQEKGILEASSRRPLRLVLTNSAMAELGLDAAK